MQYIKFFLIIVVLAAFFSRFKISLLLAIFLGLSLLFQKDSSFLITAFVFLAIPLIPYKFQQTNKVRIEKLNTQINAIGQKSRNITKEGKRADDLNKTLKKRVLQISNLYEIGKQMSVSLEFRDILQVLTGILSKNFQFRNCYLLIANDEIKNSLSIEKIYRIGPEDRHLLSRNSEIGLKDVGEYCRKSWKVVSESKKPFFIFEETVASVPLIVENKMLGILTAEDLKESDFDNFSILGGQLALELRKINLYKRIQELAITDGLTGILVRRHFLKRLDEEMVRSERYGLKLSFLMVDIDHFKQKNDNYGHLVGDVLLKETAQILKANLREIDLLGRYGGEEFSIVLPDTDREGAWQVAERIRLAMEEYDFRAYEELIKITVSVGTAVFPDDAANSQDLIDKADSALYRAKQAGRNRVCAVKN